MKKLIILILLSSFLSACFKDDFIDSGIETRIFGRIFDSKNNIPVANHKLKIKEYNSVPSLNPGPNDYFVQDLDSTTTDSDGFFDFTFTTSGRGDLYYLSSESNDSLWTYSSGHEEIRKLGNALEVNFYFLHLYPVNLKITLDAGVEYLPVRISSRYTYLGDRLTETNVEYIEKVFTDKNFEDEIRFIRTKPDGHFQIADFALPATNTTSLTEFEIFVTNDDFID